MLAASVFESTSPSFAVTLKAGATSASDHSNPAPSETTVYAQAVARRLAAKPLASLIETKRLMKKGYAQQVMAAMAEEGASFGRMLSEPAAKEAFGAFMERRKPDFSSL